MIFTNEIERRTSWNGPISAGLRKTLTRIGGAGLLLLLVTSASLAQPLEFPDSPRTLGLAGAVVSLANDAHGSLHNPAGLGTQRRIAYEVTFSQATGRGVDRFSIALVNPENENGARFGTGVWTQGHLRTNQCGFIVPYSTTAWSFGGSLHVGATLRFPLHIERVACADVPKLSLVDMGILFAPNTYRIGASIERLIGGGAEIVPRRLNFGAAAVPDPRFSIAYEWRSEDIYRDFDFHFASSRLGSEVIIGDYLALRGGYRWATRNHVSFGLAVGTLDEGWRIEGGWDLPTSRNGATLWAVGLSYSAGGKEHRKRYSP